MRASVGSSSATLLAVGSTFMTLAVPAHADGLQNIFVTDPGSGASTSMTGALTYGAGASDSIVLLSGGNDWTPVGVQAEKPMSVHVVASDGITPVGGATIGWSGTNDVQVSACGGAPSCSVTSDQDGNASTWLTASAPGAAYITATLAPGVYSPSKSVTGTLSATQSSSDIGVSPPVYIFKGASVSVPVTARVLSNGTSQNNVPVSFSIVSRSGVLSAGTAVSNANGYATVTLSLTNISVSVQVTACVSPGNAPCAVFSANPVSSAQLVLQQVSGAGQISTGQSFQPVVVRVVDSAAAPHPVLGAPLSFLMTVMRPGGFAPGISGGETNTGNPGMPVILKVAQSNATTDANGLASIAPSSGGFSAPVEVDVSASTGSSAFLDVPLLVLPPPPISNGNVNPIPVPVVSHPVSGTALEGGRSTACAWDDAVLSNLYKSVELRSADSRGGCPHVKQ